MLLKMVLKLARFCANFFFWLGTGRRCLLSLPSSQFHSFISLLHIKEWIVIILIMLAVQYPVFFCARYLEIIANTLF